MTASTAGAVFMVRSPAGQRYNTATGYCPTPSYQPATLPPATGETKVQVMGAGPTDLARCLADLARTMVTLRLQKLDRSAVVPVTRAAEVGES